LPINRLSLEPDEDVTRFEIKLNDIIGGSKTWKPYRKRWLPPLVSDARELSLVRWSKSSPTIWFDHERQDEMECLFEEVLGILNSCNSRQLQQAVVPLAERVLGLASQHNISASGKAPLNVSISKKQVRKNYRFK